FPSTGQLDQRFSYYTTDGVFALTLKSDEESPFKPQSDEEKGADKDKDKDKKDEKADSGKKDEKSGKDKDSAKKDDTRKDEKKDEKKEESPKAVQIDLNGIEKRIAAAPVAGGIYGNLMVRKGKVFFQKQPQEVRAQGTDEDDAPRNVLHVFDLEKREDKELLAGIDGYNLSLDGKKVIYKAGQSYGIQDTEPGKAKVGEGKLNLGELQVQIDPREEWRQMLHEAWRNERDFYWDPAM